MRELCQWGRDDSPEMPGPLKVVLAEGLYVWVDGETKSYVDLVQGFSTTNWGHRHPDIVKAAVQAIAHVDHVVNFMDPVEERVSQMLVQGCGLRSGRVYYDVGGAQIVRMALHAATLATGRARVGCLSHCFHGYGYSDAKLVDAFLHPSLPRTSCESVEVLAVESLDATARIRQCDLAAVIIEPIQGAAGFRKLSSTWLQEIARACAESGTLLISDEIQVGLGRVGSFTALEQAQVQADIYLFGKALGGGIFPISALVARDGILPPLLSEPWGFGSTYSNNQFGLRIADAVLQLLCSTLAEGQVGAKGTLLCHGLQSSTRRDGIAHIRSYGLALAVDFDSASSASAFHRAAFADRIVCHISGVGKDKIKMLPPLNTGDEDLVELSIRLGNILSNITAA